MSITVRDMINMAETQLAEAGCESPKYDAEALYMHVFSVDKMGLFKTWGNTISEKEADLYFDEVEKRRNRVPLQHITGTVEFMGHVFDVCEDVLIPRHDTEILVGTVLDDVAAISKDGKGMALLDLCCGSGVIGLSLASALPAARVVLADISEPAVGLAGANRAKLAAAAPRTNAAALKKVGLRQGDLFGPFKKRFRPAKFNIIITNPPYIPTAEIATLEPEVREHEPQLALDGGDDGLEFYRRILNEAPAHLNRGGSLYMEIGAEQAAAIEKIAAETEAYESEITIKKDLAGKDRIMILKLKNSDKNQK